MRHELNPAHRVVQLLGGCRSLGRELEINASTISRWQTAYDDGGTGGRIPQKHWSSIVRLAKKRGVSLSLADLAGKLD